MVDPTTAPSRTEEHHRFRELADAMPQLVWTADDTGVVDYYNARAAEYDGLRRREDGTWTWEPVLHPADADATVRAWLHSVATGQQYEVEHRVRMRDGSFRWHISRGIPAAGPDGVRRWYGTATDIHATRLAREAVFESEERLRLATDVTGLGTYDIDVASGERYWSPTLRRILGIGPDDPLPQIHALVHPDDMPAVRAAAAARLEPGGDGTYRVEHRIVRPDGSVRWIADQARTFFDGTGPDRQPTRVIGTAVDITERKQAEQLREAFIGMLSHELRTPVTSIFGGAQMLRRANLDPATRDSILDDVVSETARLVGMVENLLVIAKVERQANLGEPEPLLLRPIIARVIEAARREWPHADIRLEEPRGIRGVALGDEAAVELVLRNLVSNALKYGGPSVVVRTGVADDGSVALCVLDEGPGLAGVDMTRLFDLFYRPDIAKRTAAGAGIGLFVVKALVDSMGGRIWANDRPSGGAEFGIALPAAPG